MQINSIWQHICENYSCRIRESSWVPEYVFAALRLHGYETLRSEGHTPKDAHEVLLHRILHSHHPTAFIKHLQTVLHQEPHGVLEALCMLRRHRPEIQEMLYKSNDELNHWFSQHSKFLSDTLPRHWKYQDKAHAIRVMISLVRSVELWLEAIFRVINK